MSISLFWERLFYILEFRIAQEKRTRAAFFIKAKAKPAQEFRGHNRMALV
jgi:hypothetical protein